MAEQKEPGTSTDFEIVDQFEAGGTAPEISEEPILIEDPEATWPLNR